MRSTKGVEGAHLPQKAPNPQWSLIACFCCGKDGAPERIISDRGIQFTFSFWQEFLKVLGTAQGLSSSFRPMEAVRELMACCSSTSIVTLITSKTIGPNSCSLLKLPTIIQCTVAQVSPFLGDHRPGHFVPMPELPQHRPLHVSLAECIKACRILSPWSAKL